MSSPTAQIISFCCSTALNRYLLSIFDWFFRNGFLDKIDTRCFPIAPIPKRRFSSDEFPNGFSAANINYREFYFHNLIWYGWDKLKLSDNQSGAMSGNKFFPTERGLAQRGISSNPGYEPKTNGRECKYPRKSSNPHVGSGLVVLYLSRCWRKQ